METFTTYDNNQKINVKVTTNSVAQQDGKCAFSLRVAHNLGDFIVLPNLNDTNTTKIEKAKAKQHKVLQIVTDFRLDENQISQKERIMQTTKIVYSLFDINTRATFYSTFSEYPEEYDETTKPSLFRITKRIAIELKPNLVEQHRAFVRTLN